MQTCPNCAPLTMGALRGPRRVTWCRCRRRPTRRPSGAAVRRTPAEQTSRAGGQRRWWRRRRARSGRRLQVRPTRRRWTPWRGPRRSSGEPREPRSEWSRWPQRCAHTRAFFFLFSAGRVGVGLRPVHCLFSSFTSFLSLSFVCYLACDIQLFSDQSPRGPGLCTRREAQLGSDVHEALGQG